MKIFTDIDNLHGMKNPVVTIGAFDGVHLGHQSLIGRVRQLAETIDGESVVVTFDPHPKLYFGTDSEFFELTTLEVKLRLFEEYGVDNVVIVPFGRVVNISSREFLERYLLNGIGSKHIVVGYNHNFGRDKKGDYNSLKEYAKELDFYVEQHGKLMLEGEKISSTAIRKATISGNLELASRLLGR